MNHRDDQHFIAIEPLLSPDPESQLLEGLYSLYTDPPPDWCTRDKAEGVLAGTLDAVRRRGEPYSNDVYSSLSRRNPVLAELLKNAAIRSDGRIEFK